ncbi:FAD-binding and (Fe-S)-binding domain-containing protein [Candidatus Leptofilum sp.]|uniref:FAD-binding and (Fe-S)-binding domain-containing protein n=1 Tax=Candidatus Leptofilum sp. TaxID=3241576 RepID=UPI003B58B750
MSEALFDFLNELGKRTSGDLRTDEYSRILYSTDASIYQVKPHAVLLPQTVDDVQAAVELAAKHQVPLLPRTGGSSLAGQAVNHALVMDFTRHLDKVLEVNQEERWVRVQPGIVLDALNIYLRKYGLQFGPDPASSNRAAMGGIVSNNSTGSHSIMYGMTADHVLEMELLLADGTLTHFGSLESAVLLQQTQKSGLEGDIYRQIVALTQDPTNQEIIRSGTPRHWRRCGGYNLDRLVPVVNGRPTYHWPYDGRFNLAKLVCGAEGGLGVITELKLNLVPLSQHTALAIVHFNSLPEALTAVPLMLEVGPSAVELLDNLGLTMCRDVPEYARLLATFIQGTPNCVLITEFYGENEAEVVSKIDNLERHLKGQMVNFAAVSRALTPQQQTNVWTVRKVGLGLMMSIKGDHKPIPFIEDAAVPVEHLSEYVTKVEQFCNDIGTDVAYYAHASAGCIHIRPLINTKTAKEVAKLPAITEFSVDLLRGYGGSFSSEHGDGRARSWLNEKFFGPDLYRLYQQVKQIFDPHNILNPDTIVNAGPMTENLRYGESYQVIPIIPHLDFSSDHGFDRAVEMCNGAGICRKRTTGTMCPSFMATREEEHATRGRANALRAAMSGTLPSSEFTSERMYQVMALCVSCKACKAECPSSVDMAKIKTEFLAQYHDAHGTPLRDKLFASITPLSRLGSGSMAPLANWTLGNGLIRQGLERTLGISAKRSLPKFARQSFTDWFHKHTPVGAHHDVPLQKVVLFNDTFSTYNYPHIAIAATEVLEASGFEVVLPGVMDCGRPSFSKGLVNKARAIAITVLDHLAPLAEQGLPIIFLEPSDLSAIMDDYESLLPNDKRVALVAKQSRSFEAFIAELADNGNLNLNFTDEARHLVLHGHCHQKALIGTKPAHRALTLPPNYTLEEVDSSCCGMAGSFGYQAEHYDISLIMAERRLLPAMRAAAPDTILVAPGVSCRQQIKHGAGRQVLHPAEVLRAALK